MNGSKEDQKGTTTKQVCTLPANES